MVHRERNQPDRRHRIAPRRRRQRCSPGRAGSDGRGGGSPGGGNAGNLPGRGLRAQPELPGLRRRAAAVPEQAEERPVGAPPERPRRAGAHGLQDGPVQGHDCLNGTPSPPPPLLHFLNPRHCLSKGNEMNAGLHEHPPII